MRLDDDRDFSDVLNARKQQLERSLSTVSVISWAASQKSESQHLGAREAAALSDAASAYPAASPSPPVPRPRPRLTSAPRAGPASATASAPKQGPYPQKQPLQLCPAPAAAAARVGAEFSAKETGRCCWPCACCMRATGTAEVAACGGDLGALLASAAAMGLVVSAALPLPSLCSCQVILSPHARST